MGYIFCRYPIKISLRPQLCEGVYFSESDFSDTYPFYKYITSSMHPHICISFLAKTLTILFTLLLSWLRVWKCSFYAAILPTK
ncbi:hypothetical protein ACTXT7_016357, partial [Hymenolepis weldensis]